MVKTSEGSMAAFFCSYTPQEIMVASGFQVKRIIPLGYDPSLANTFLDSNFCPFVRSIFSWATKHSINCQIMPLILVNSCDGMRRLYDVLKYHFSDSFIYLLDLPRKKDSGSEKLFASYLYDLKSSFEKYTGQKITKESLKMAIKKSNQFRTMATRLAEMRQNKNIILSYYDFIKLIQNENNALEEVFQKYSKKYLVKDSPIKANSQKRSVKKNSPRILLTGTVLDQFEIIKLIEQFGGVIEVADFCNAWRYYMNTIDEANPDPIAALARFYLRKIPCPRMLDSLEREEKLVTIGKDHQVDGIIFYTQKFCDLSLFQIPLLRERMNSIGIPSLYLEGEFSKNCSGQIKTRIQAFMEELEFGK